MPRSPEEIDKRQDRRCLFKKAEEQGLGVVSLGTKMIDPPVAKRALRTIGLAMKLGLIRTKLEGEYDD